MILLLMEEILFSIKGMKPTQTLHYYQFLMDDPYIMVYFTAFGWFPPSTIIVTPTMHF